MHVCGNWLQSFRNVLELSCNLPFAIFLIMCRRVAGQSVTSYGRVVVSNVTRPFPRTGRGLGTRLRTGPRERARAYS